MSLPPPRNKQPVSAAALLGACLAAVTSVPAAAFIASLCGDTYHVRAAVYCCLLLWAVVGATVVFRLTHKSETERFSLPRVFLWFVSAWIWPLLLFARMVNK